jgi:transposase
MLGRGAKDKEHAMSQKLESAIAVIGIDIGKNSFHVVGHDERGAIVLRQKWSRGQVEARFANMPTCLIGMEACVGAHHLSRKLKALGHDARLMPAKYVRPYGSFPLQLIAAFLKSDSLTRRGLCAGCVANQSYP